MLPKSQRLDKATFKSIIEQKRVISTPLFLFFYNKSLDIHYSFVAPKKIFKTAVQRNKYRRFGYNYLKTLNLQAGSGVFFYKNTVLSLKPEEIKDNIFFILKRAGFVKNEENTN